MTDYRRWISANALRQLLDSSADTKHHLPAGSLDICEVRLGNADPSPAEGHYVLLTFTDETQRYGTAFTPPRVVLRTPAPPPPLKKGS